MKPRHFNTIQLIVNIFVILAAGTFMSCPQVDFPPEFLQLTGRVVDGIGGSPVEGANVRIEGTSYPIVTTDINGEFSFTEIRIGVYDLLVTKDGMAGSRLSQVRIAKENTYVELIQPEYGFLPSATSPPSIIVQGLNAGSEYSGNVQINVRAVQGSCPVVGTEFHSSIYLKFGSTPMSYYEAARSNDDMLSYTWNTGLIPPGSANVKVVAYDNNNNRCELDIPVIIVSNAGKPPSVALTKDDYYIIATTYSGSMNIYRSFPDLITFQEPLSPGTRSQADTTITVEFSVAKYYNGVAIFKASAATGPYELCGETAYTTSGDYRFLDYSPTLNPGTTVWYKLAYYNQYGTGPQTDGISVWIQPRYHLSLVSPLNNSIVAETAPTLTWGCEWPDSIEPSGERTDWIVVTNVIDASIVTNSLENNTTEFTLPVLIPNNKYEWDVSSIYEYRNSSVLSRSFPKGQGSYDHSMNGAFYFTIGTN